MLPRLPMHCTYPVLGKIFAFFDTWMPFLLSPLQDVTNLRHCSQIIFPLEYFPRFLVKMSPTPFSSNSTLFQLHAFLLHFSMSLIHRVWQLILCSPYIIIYYSSLIIKLSPEILSPPPKLLQVEGHSLKLTSSFILCKI